MTNSPRSMEGNRCQRPNPTLGASIHEVVEKIEQGQIYDVPLELSSIHMTKDEER